MTTHTALTRKDFQNWVSVRLTSPSRYLHNLIFLNTEHQVVLYRLKQELLGNQRDNLEKEKALIFLFVWSHCLYSTCTTLKRLQNHLLNRDRYCLFQVWEHFSHHRIPRQVDMENKRPELESYLTFWKSVTVRCRAHFPIKHFKGLMVQETLNLLFKTSLFLTQVNHCSLDCHIISRASGKILTTTFFSS